MKTHKLYKLLVAAVLIAGTFQAQAWAGPRRLEGNMEPGTPQRVCTTNQDLVKFLMEFAKHTRAGNFAAADAMDIASLAPRCNLEEQQSLYDAIVNLIKTSRSLPRGS